MNATRRRGIAAVLALTSALVVAGASATAQDPAEGPPQNPAPRLKGKVSYDGRPVAAGRIFFHVADGQFFGATIRNGVYAIDDPPAGQWKVTIEGPGIPESYADPNGLPLTALIAPAMNSIDIQLTPPGPRKRPVPAPR